MAKQKEQKPAAQAPAPQAEAKKEPGLIEKVIDAVLGHPAPAQQASKQNEASDLQKHPKFAKFKQGEK